MSRSKSRRGRSWRSSEPWEPARRPSCSRPGISRRDSREGGSSGPCLAASGAQSCFRHPGRRSRAWRSPSGTRSPSGRRTWGGRRTRSRARWIAPSSGSSWVRWRTAASDHRCDPRHGLRPRAVRRAGGRARCRGREGAVAADPRARAGRESGPAGDERPRCPTRRGRSGRVARGRRRPGRRDAGTARRCGGVRRGAGHERRHGLGGERASRTVSPDRGPRRATLAVIPARRFDGVTFSYGAVAVLHGLSFAITPGERVALLGKNGAGKSTVVRLIAGLERPGEGTVWVGDWNTRDCLPEQLAWRVGSVFQHADQQLFARTVREDVRFGPRALGVGEQDVERRTDRALADLDLTAHAGPLALEPALLVLDEPTIGLDRALRARVTRALLDRSAGSVALLVITHDLTFAAESLERGLVLDRGSLVCDELLAVLLGDAKRLEPLGLAPPPVAALSVALDLPGRPVRAADAARALARVARGRPGP